MENDTGFKVTVAMYRPDEQTQELMGAAFRYGKFEKAMDIARNLHKMCLSTAEIVEVTGLSDDDVEWAKQFD